MESEFLRLAESYFQQLCGLGIGQLPAVAGRAGNQKPFYVRRQMPKMSCHPRVINGPVVIIVSQQWTPQNRDVVGKNSLEELLPIKSDECFIGHEWTCSSSRAQQIVSVRGVGRRKFGEQLTVAAIRIFAGRHAQGNCEALQRGFARAIGQPLAFAGGESCEAVKRLADAE